MTQEIISEFGTYQPDGGPARPMETDLSSRTYVLTSIASRLRIMGVLGEDDKMHPQDVRLNTPIAQGSFIQEMLRDRDLPAEQLRAILYCTGSRSQELQIDPSRPIILQGVYFARTLSRGVRFDLAQLFGRQRWGDDMAVTFPYLWRDRPAGGGWPNSYLQIEDEYDKELAQNPQTVFVTRQKIYLGPHQKDDGTFDSGVVLIAVAPAGWRIGVGGLCLPMGFDRKLFRPDGKIYSQEEIQTYGSAILTEDEEIFLRQITANPTLAIETIKTLWATKARWGAVVRDQFLLGKSRVLVSTGKTEAQIEIRGIGLGQAIGQGIVTPGNIERMQSATQTWGATGNLILSISTVGGKLIVRPSISDPSHLRNIDGVSLSRWAEPRALVWLLSRLVAI